MRHEQDFILRHFQQVGRLAARVLGMAGGGQYAQAHEAIAQTAGELFGLDLDALLQIADEDIVAHFQLDTAVSWVERCILLATLFQKDADIFAAEDHWDESYPRYLKALNLLLVALTSGHDLFIPENAPSVAGLLAELEAVILPDATRVALLGYYEQSGQFDKAEDVLFAWLEDNPAAVQAYEMGEAFYGRLQNLSDAELIAGNLPRAEIEAGLADLRNRE
jgi:tetratricopeptide (TPR) repeat protein